MGCNKCSHRINNCETNVTEAELLDGCRKGDREAQRKLYEATSERIYRLLLKMTRRPETAFDLAQDTYVLAFTRIAQFNGQSSLSTWLYRIAVNAALQFLRRAEPAQLESDVVTRASDNGSEIDRVAAAVDLESVMSRMDAADRTILLLRYVEGLDYQAIAEVLECPGGTVASRLNRARQRARELLAEGYRNVEETGHVVHRIKGRNEGSVSNTLAGEIRLETGSS